MYEKITLPNGLRVLYENIPHVRSVAMGVWVATGSRYEKASQSGASHYIEHMLFKGTDTKTAAQLAEEMDEIGGQINAFTTKECIWTDLQICSGICSVIPVLARKTFRVSGASFLKR